jgi:heavy metal translocating P-type ATPase
MANFLDINLNIGNLIINSCYNSLINYAGQMKKLVSFVKNYRLFCAAIVAGLAGLVLQLSHHHDIAFIVLGIVAMVEVLPLLWDMFQDVRSGKYGIDILAATAIVASVILRQEWAAIVVVLMLTGGQSLENYAERRAQSELDSLLKNAPVKAFVVRKGKTIEIPVDEIKLNDKILIKPGEVVPVDSIIIDGQANFDESSITGESLPDLKRPGDNILSGSINVDGAITAKATALAEDSQYQQIIRLVKSAAASEAPFVRLADRYSLPFTVSAYAIATAVWVLSGHAIRFLEVIIVATPCPLLLAAPIALISGMARASRYGIIVRNGSSLEKLAEARTIAFDKTGTLTRGELSVKEIKSFNKHTHQEILALAASLDQNSNHVLAKAIVSDAQLKKIKLIKVKGLEEIAGLGVRANLKGKDVLVGNHVLMERYDVKAAQGFSAKSVDQTAAYIAEGGHLIGVIYFSDEVRREAKTTLEELNRLGLKHIVMITGDNKVAAEAIASQLSISKVYAEALPADKLHILEKLKPRPIVFVGDGINDAPVLSAADVGIALGARGSTAASESADMIVMLDDLSKVASGVEIAKRTFQIAKQSILIGIGLSVILMLVFASGKFPPLAGALIQEVVDVFVIFNALKAHTIRPSMMDE